MGNMDERFRSMFFEEAEGLLTHLSGELGVLNTHPDDPEHLTKAFRAAHTLKGAASMVGFSPIGDFAQDVEAVLDRMRSGARTVDRDVIATLIEARDHLAIMVEAAKSMITTPPIPGPPESLAQRLARLREP